MKVEELLTHNNKLRVKLTEENRKYYEDMLVYIRLSYDKSEKETEEILSELLGHLIEAQQEGRTAEDVFGKDPKKYADNIIGELPKMVSKERLLLGSMSLLYFLGVSVFFIGIVRMINQYVIPIDQMTNEYYILSVVVKTLTSIPIAFLLIFGALQYLRWACFKNISRVKDFFILWGWEMLSIGIFVLVYYLVPDIGPVIEVSGWFVALLGIFLYLAGSFVKRISTNN
ncbi:DUF1129 family protein [Evansella sp. AB-P1]|uniref:DUF1129 family protein n=1 Tax=Evansella sp. AB-P1 TaxID=3037653 RepID=UPI00241BFE31|nr:DUF1129 family protein [Evansella sp. AB-P1]MDG5788510.1 DUF1129 family protein [Evansella sp. AB-P1]